MKCVIGMDFGTLSARAILVDAADGRILRSHTVQYPHGVMEGDLASTEDYREALCELLETMAEGYAEHIAGICVDATSCTLVPLGSDGRALTENARWSGRKHAQIKLWKYHSAQKQADEAQALARRTEEPFLARTGGSIQCEWALPKLLEIRDEDMEVYAEINCALDLNEYLTYLLTGEITRSGGSLGFKGLWSRELGFPSEGFLDALRPGFAAEYKSFLRGPVMRPGERAGFMRPELCARFGLGRQTAVASGLLDAHTAMAAMGALQPEDCALVVGTSCVQTVQMRAFAAIPEVCGVVLDGMCPGLYGIEASQSASGDMLDWFVQRAVPEQIAEQARAEGVSVHQLLSGRVRRPWENRVVAADWWNGSRSAPCDLALSGAVVGLTLNTRPEELYLALLQAIVCGTRENLEQCARSGAPVRRVFATGGVAQKNPLLMQQYADILNRTVLVGAGTEGPALGAAVYASLAAGLHDSLETACAHMGEKTFVRYEPDAEHRAEYETLFRRNHLLRQMAIRLKEADAETGEAI